MKIAKSNVTTVIDVIIDGIELQMAENNKHVIRTETIKNRAMEYLFFDGQNEETRKCTEIGFDQMVHSRLNERGYRSVRTGRFINLERCDSVIRLEELLKNADTSVEDKKKIWKRIKDKLDGQMKMSFDGADLVGYEETMTEEEFLADLEADAV